MTRRALGQFALTRKTTSGEKVAPVGRMLKSSTMNSAVFVGCR